MVGHDGGVDARLIGKQRGLTRPYPVIFHLLDTAAVAGVLWNVLVPMPSRERFANELGLAVADARALFMFMAGAHDFGKIAPSFQHNILSKGELTRLGYPGPDLSAGEIKHAYGTQLLLPRMLVEWGFPGAGKRATRSLAHWVGQLLGGHHGVFSRAERDWERHPVSCAKVNCGDGPWDDQRTHHIEELRRITDAMKVPSRPLDAAATVQWCGLIILADWLASQSTFIENRMSTGGWDVSPAGLDEHFVQVTSEAPGIVADAGLGPAQLKCDAFSVVFPEIEKPYPLQTSVAEGLPPLVTGPGLVLITAPMGDGKTETGLYAATVLAQVTGAHGICFALPTMATTDKMHPRLQNFVGSNASGARPVTLSHSLAFLSRDGGVVPEVESGIATSGVDASDWLHGRHRPLWANYSTCTIDQLLTGVLPVRYNVLRLAALLGKTLIIDEAHAYGPWMHRLLERLLEWCGAMQVPVVLMSATLTGRTAASLVQAYRRGCGHTDAPTIEPRYPGWLFVDAGTGVVSTPEEVGTVRQQQLSVDLVPVRSDSMDERTVVLEERLSPIRDEGGCAMVVCGTVAAAQETWERLCEWAGDGMDVRLLHSRFPAWRREQVTDECQAAYGKHYLDSPRPASILVTTSIVEMSVDFDFDLVITDLAPLAMLLQRAGRQWRHDRKQRPEWAGTHPTLVVLEPVNESGQLSPPPEWKSIYPRAQLRRSAESLRLLDGRAISIPDDVQDMIDRAYAEDFVDRGKEAAREEGADWLAALDEEDMAELGDKLAQQILADQIMIKSPDSASDLSVLSGGDSAELVLSDLITTRLGADSQRIVCLYHFANGTVSLRADQSVPVPGLTGRSLNENDIKTIMSHTIPVPSNWIRDRDTTLPNAWQERALTKHLVVLHMRPSGNGWGNEEGRQELLIDTACERGLSRLMGVHE